MPQLPISLSADIIEDLNKIARGNNKELTDGGKEPTIRASTVAARIVRKYFEKESEQELRKKYGLTDEGFEALEKETKVKD